MAFDLQNWLFGSSPGMQQAPTMTQGQQGLQNQLVGGLGGVQGQGLQYLMQLLSNDPEAFKAFEDPLKQQFQQEIIPDISEQFAGMGSGGSFGSGLNNSLARAGQELSTNLAGLRAGLKNNALQALQGMQSQAFQPSFQNVYDPGGYGVAGGFLQGIGQGAGKFLFS